jgi:hypothetical protein
MNWRALMRPDDGECGECSSRYSANQSSPTKSKLLFWPFPPGALLREMLACGVALDRGRNPRDRQPPSHRQLKPNDVCDVSSESCRVMSRARAPGTAISPNGIERLQVLVQLRNDVLSHELPAFRRVIGSPPRAYSDAHQTREMLAQEPENRAGDGIRVDERNCGIPRRRLRHDDALFQHSRCLNGARFRSPRLRASDGDANVLNRRSWWPVCLVEELRKDVRYGDSSLGMWRRCSVRFVDRELYEFVTDGADLVAVSLPFRLAS